MSNTHPNTPPGKLFAFFHVWHPAAPDTIKAIIKRLKGLEASSVVEIQAWIAIIKANLNNVPEVVFEVLKLSKEEVAAILDEIEKDVLLVASAIKL